MVMAWILVCLLKCVQKIRTVSHPNNHMESFQRSFAFIKATSHVARHQTSLIMNIWHWYIIEFRVKTNLGIWYQLNKQRAIHDFTCPMLGQVLVSRSLRGPTNCWEQHKLLQACPTGSLASLEKWTPSETHMTWRSPIQPLYNSQ